MLNPRLLIHIDNILSIPYRVLLHLFILSRKRKVKQEPEQVFVIKMMGIGSITRIYRSLLDQKVDFSKTLFISLQSNKDLFKALGLTNIKLLNDSNLMQVSIELIKLSFFIRKSHPSYLINYERASSLLGLFQIMSTWFTKTGVVSFHDFNTDIRTNIDTIYSLEGNYFQKLINVTDSYYIKGVEKKESLYQEIVVNKKKVLININASDYMPFRKYPIDSFQKIIEMLHDWDNDLIFDLIGSAKEEQYVDNLLSKINSDDIVIVNRCGKWSIPDLMNEFSDCALFITNDSGPMHLAAMVETPMIAIWGPTSSNHFGYQSPLITNIQTAESCSPCFTYAKSKAAKSCNKRIDCLNNIKANDIFKASKNTLSNLNSVRSVNIIKNPHTIVEKQNHSLAL